MQFSELAKVSVSQLDMVLGVSVSDPEVEPSGVWKTFCSHLQSPGVILWYTGSEKLELELRGFLGLTGRGMNCCGKGMPHHCRRKNTYTAGSGII